MALNFQKLLVAEKQRTCRNSDDAIKSKPEKSNPENSNVCKHNVNIIPYELSLASASNLDSYKIGAINSMYYVPDFLSEEQEISLLGQIKEEGNIRGKGWHQLRTRRVMCFGDPTVIYAFEKDSVFPMPDWLSLFNDSFSSSSVWKSPTHYTNWTPNHILINQYEPGEGIMHHTDGPVYVGQAAIISTGASVLMTFRPNLSSAEVGLESNADVFSVILRPRSLFVFNENIYEKYLHGIDVAFGQPASSEHIFSSVLESNTHTGADTAANGWIIQSHCLNCESAHISVGDVVRTLQ